MISYLAAVAAAATNATSNVLNRKAAREEPARLRFRPRLILDLMRRRVWLASVAAMVASFVLASAALGTGQLAAVEPVIIVELPMTLIGATFVLGAAIRALDWAATAAMTAGLAGLLILLSPRSGHAQTVASTTWIVGSLANGFAILALSLVAWTRRSPAAQAAFLGAACGSGYGLAAAFTKGMTQEFASGGVVAVISSWQLYAAMGAGMVSTWLLENAYHAGKLTAAQPGITLIDPVVGVAWGLTAFGEQVRHGWVLALAVVPVIVIAWGAAVLSRSPALQGTAGAREGQARDGSEDSAERRERAGTTRTRR